MDQISGKPYWRLHFDEKGQLTSPPSGDVISEIVNSGVKNLFVFSHGWGNTDTDAEDLYQAMFSLVADTAAAPADIGFAGVFWPSIWFPDETSTQAPNVASAVAAGNPGAADAAFSGAQITDTIKASFPADVHPQLTEMGNLVDEGLAGVATMPSDEQQQRLEKFHSLLNELVTPATSGTEDLGERPLLVTDDPKADYQSLAGVMGSATGGGDAQDLGSVFHKVWSGAKDMLRVFSYYEMKNRAGVAGEHGLGPLLEKLHGSDAAIRVHLIGHSFGARLVSYSLKGITSPAGSPVASLLLIQGAFSHWCFAEQNDMPFGQAGALHAVEDRVHGPLVSTFSTFDWAVGHWYPRASFASQDMTQDLVDPKKWGGMGFDGFQGSLPSKDDRLASDHVPSGLVAGTFYRVDCTATIKDTSASAFSGAHSDIRHPEVAALAIAAAAG